LHSKNLLRETKVKGKSPNIFVGHTNYPKVKLGYLLTQKYEHNDEPKFFIENKLQIPQIITKRRQLLNSSINVSIKDSKNKILDEAKLIAKSSSPVDTEISLTNLKGSFTTDNVAMPFGPSAELKKINITENVKIEKHIEKITDDTDILANTALTELNKHFIDEYQLTKLLSIGTLGKNPKLVPTKWAITAVDDKIGIDNYKEILTYPEIDFKICTSQYLGNKYIICFFPAPYSFEFIEIIFPRTKDNNDNVFKVDSDYEFTQGRKTYAEVTAGGYYASRLPILEHLKKIKKQARVIVFRCITDDYTTPLGVWVVREGTKESLKHKVKDVEEHQAKEIIRFFLRKYGMLNPDLAIKKSILLKEKQTSINNFK
jgi:DNA repair protein NreA